MLRHRILANVIGISVSLSGLLLLPDKGNAQSFTTIDVPGAIRSQARYLNPRGDIVGFYTAADGTMHGFLRSKDGELNTIDAPDNAPGGFTSALGINPQGDIVGSYGSAVKQHGFLLTNAGTFTTLDFPGAMNTSASAINARGDIAGAYTAGGTTHGFIRDADGNYTSFDVPGATFTAANDIDSKGQIVGGYGSGGTNHGFLRAPDGGFTYFDVPGAINPAVGTQTRGINDAGDIVGWFVISSGARRGFILSHGEFTFIDFPGALGTDTDGINSPGDVVGGYDGTDHKHHAYVRTK